MAAVTAEGAAEAVRAPAEESPPLRVVLRVRERPSSEGFAPAKAKLGARVVEQVFSFRASDTLRALRTTCRQFAQADGFDLLFVALGADVVYLDGPDELTLQLAGVRPQGTVLIVLPPPPPPPAPLPQEPQATASPPSESPTAHAAAIDVAASHAAAAAAAEHKLSEAAPAMTAELVWQVLESASPPPELLRQANDFLHTRTAAALAAPQWCSVSSRTVDMLVRDNSLGVHEVEVFRACLRWARAECVRAKLPQEPASLRRVLGGALQLIRFPLLTAHELATEVHPSGLLDEADMVALYSYAATKGRDEALVALRFSVNPRGGPPLRRAAAGNDDEGKRASEALAYLRFLRGNCVPPAIAESSLELRGTEGMGLAVGRGPVELKRSSPVAFHVTISNCRGFVLGVANPAHTEAVMRTPSRGGEGIIGFNSFTGMLQGLPGTHVRVATPRASPDMVISVRIEGNNMTCRLVAPMHASGTVRLPAGSLRLVVVFETPGTLVFAPGEAAK